MYEYACSYEDRDDVAFQVVNWRGHQNYRSHAITDHSFSSLEVKDAYLKKHKFASIDSLAHREIRVSVRRLDTIIRQINVDTIDFVSIDVEGWNWKCCGDSPWTPINRS